jgi:type II secretory pathway predicted ATPase ExeA
MRGNLLSFQTPYLEFFGLSEAPFPATPDAGRILPALSYDSSCAALVHGITERRGLLCLVGEAGTGKTLLLRQLLGAPPPGIRPVVLPESFREFNAWVEAMARQVGAASSAGLTGLRTALAADAGRNVVLLVDEAETLRPETLAGLPQLTRPLPGASASAMQVLLAGRPALLKSLSAAGLRDRIAVLARLDPWVPSDVAVYIHGQLAHAGADRRLFTPGAVARLARLTGGVPRLVNAIADASLAVAASVGADAVTELHVNAAWEGKSLPDAPATVPAEPDEPRFVRRSALPSSLERMLRHEPRFVRTSALPSSLERMLRPPTRTTVRRRTRATHAVFAGALLIGIVVAWWHRGAGTTPVPRRVAAAPPRVAAAPPPPPAGEPLPTASEALDAVDAFRRAYEAKDTAAVEDLLALEATGGGVGRLAAVAPDVRVLDQLEDVTYLQPAAQVEPRGAAMEVRTSFEVRYRDRTGRTGELRGTAVWQVARRDGAPRIVGVARALAPGSVLPDGVVVTEP